MKRVLLLLVIWGLMCWSDLRRDSSTLVWAAWFTEFFGILFMIGCLTCIGVRSTNVMVNGVQNGQHVHFYGYVSSFDPSAPPATSGGCALGLMYLYLFGVRGVMGLLMGGNPLLDVIYSMPYLFVRALFESNTQVSALASISHVLLRVPA